eukprot:CAMPEP_0118664124 /NCGR_PEP_ID=MMETSP0785-20121206/17825_1 /TAXON_ID=91992 /ORGANISM="Bolidomonas pacifica, Strain CCMP 1866" /LENGTH=81 /DNA_ID=CAMNT_0006557969 /DNA_START=130 /DNA_END=372 /DNA_ORIENTATION=+
MTRYAATSMPFSIVPIWSHLTDRQPYSTGARKKPGTKLAPQIRNPIILTKIFQDSEPLPLHMTKRGATAITAPLTAATAPF